MEMSIRLIELGMETSLIRLIKING